MDDVKKSNKVARFFRENEELIFNTALFTATGVFAIYLTFVFGMSKGARDLGEFAHIDKSTMMKFAFRKNPYELESLKNMFK